MFGINRASKIFNMNKTGFKTIVLQRFLKSRNVIKYKHQIRAKYDIPVDFTKATISDSHH